MAGELTVENASYEVLISSKLATALAEKLHLSEVQIAKANQSLLTLLTDSKLASCGQASKLRFAYTTALYDYKSPNAIAPVPYGNNVQAQLQYQAYVEDLIACGHVLETNCVALYKGIDYKGFVNQWGYKELTIPEKIELANIFEEKEIVGYYAYAKCDDGRFISCLMSIQAIREHAKRYSKTYNEDKGIWVDNFDKMARKTVIKALARIVLLMFPFDRLAWALTIDQASFTDNGIEYQDNAHAVSESNGEKVIENQVETPNNE